MVLSLTQAKNTEDTLQNFTSAWISHSNGIIMNNKTLLLVVAIINIIMMFMLVDKQNKIIKQLYELQQLHEQKNIQLEQHKDLMLQLHKAKQLSMIESHAKDNLQMQRMTLSDIDRLPEKIVEQMQGS